MLVFHLVLLLCREACRDGEMGAKPQISFGSLEAASGIGKVCLYVSKTGHQQDIGDCKVP